STYTPSNPLPNGAYYWRVRTNDGMGTWGDHSPVWTFTINGKLPLSPTLLTPANKSTISDSTPTFDWKNVPNADHYRIQIDDNADFSSPAADSQPTNSTYTPRKPLPDGRYYWRVRTADSMGNWSNYSPAWTLIVEDGASSPPTPTPTASAATAPSETPRIPPSLLQSSSSSESTPTPTLTAKTVYLTFDDGPDPFYTPQLITYLQRQDIQATFFINGTDRGSSWGGIYFTCSPGPDDLVSIESLSGEKVVTLMDSMGFEIGLHGWYPGSIAHPEDFWHSDEFDIQTNIVQQEQALASLGISFDRLLRAPGGAFPSSPFPEYRDWYYYGWDIDAKDTYGASPQTIIDNVIGKLADKPDYPIILLHAGRPNTLQAIANSDYDLIGEIKALGYEFGLLPRPIDHTGYPPNGRIYTLAP
ncbi:MAG: polysaccharide deacetylase family protein, partial [Anaerolineae bacterium]|nr:polysaccharide deacetylase family protein [Anaerolineae bacterium]